MNNWHDLHEVGDSKGKADHSILGFFIFVLLILMAYVWIFLLSGRFDGAPKEDVWRAMQTCPTKYTIELKDDGSFKGCVLTERLGERN